MRIYMFFAFYFIFKWGIESHDSGINSPSPGLPAPGLLKANFMLSVSYVSFHLIYACVHKAYSPHLLFNINVIVLYILFILHSYMHFVFFHLTLFLASHPVCKYSNYKGFFSIFFLILLCILCVQNVFKLLMTLAGCFRCFAVTVLQWITPWNIMLSWII